MSHQLSHPNQKLQCFNAKEMKKPGDHDTLLAVEVMLTGAGQEKMEVAFSGVALIQGSRGRSRGKLKNFRQRGRDLWQEFLSRNNFSKKTV